MRRCENILTMTELDESEQRTELEREALAKVLRLISGEATVADVEDAARWQNQSPEHSHAFALARRLWDRLGPAGRNVVERRGEDILPARSGGSRGRLTRRAMIGGAVAASAAYAIARPPWGLWPSFSELAADYRTTTGEQQQITLTDGAAVELNTQTSIALQSLAAENPRIELISGEAAITTGPGSTIVIAGDGRISARNASFDVRHDNDASCVTCLDGVVQVERHNAVVTLAARYQVTYAARGLEAPVAIDPADVTAWRVGLLVFHETPLSAVVAEINRYRPGKIVVLNADLARRRINARFHVGNVDEIMSLAQQVLGARVVSLPGGLVLLS
jgi:transmembrane sensor